METATRTDHNKELTDLIRPAVVRAFNALNPSPDMPQPLDGLVSVTVDTAENVPAMRRGLISVSVSLHAPETGATEKQQAEIAQLAERFDRAASDVRGGTFRTDFSPSTKAEGKTRIYANSESDLIGGLNALLTNLDVPENARIQQPKQVAHGVA